MKIPTSKPVSQNGMKYSRDELIKVETIAHCLCSQLENIYDYLQGVGLKSPAACIYAEMVTDIIDKIGDIETIAIGLK